MLRCPKCGSDIISVVDKLERSHYYNGGVCVHDRTKRTERVCTCGCNHTGDYEEFLVKDWCDVCGYKNSWCDCLLPEIKDNVILDVK